jgi:2-polyprenyl-6-methoxyphenol hydroxylase-like FAD-dependent oxidoreductase
LLEFRGQRAVAPLAEAVRTNPHPSVRQAAAGALAMTFQPAAVEPLVTIRRPLRIDSVRQRPAEVEIRTVDGECLGAPLAINAEGLGSRSGSASQAALVADVEVEGPSAGWASVSRGTDPLICCRPPVPRFRRSDG